MESSTAIDESSEYGSGYFELIRKVDQVGSQIQDDSKQSEIDSKSDIGKIKLCPIKPTHGKKKGIHLLGIIFQVGKFANAPAERTNMNMGVHTRFEVSASLFLHVSQT